MFVLPASCCCRAPVQLPGRNTIDSCQRNNSKGWSMFLCKFQGTDCLFNAAFQSDSLPCEGTRKRQPGACPTRARPARTANPHRCFMMNAWAARQTGTPGACRTCDINRQNLLQPGPVWAEFVGPWPIHGSKGPVQDKPLRTLRRSCAISPPGPNLGRIFLMKPRLWCWFIVIMPVTPKQ